MKNFFIPLLLLLPLSALSLFSDQAGLNDFTLVHAGGLVLSARSCWGTLLVTTEAYTLASLSAEAGEVVWRRVFEAEPSQVVCGIKNRVVVASGTVVRSFGVLQGDLGWEFECGSKVRDVVVDGGEVVVVLCGNRVVGVDAGTGAAASKWMREVVDVEKAETAKVAVVGNDVFVVSAANGEVTVQMFEGSNKGKPVSFKALPGFALTNNGLLAYHTKVGEQVVHLRDLTTTAAANSTDVEVPGGVQSVSVVGGKVISVLSTTSLVGIISKLGTSMDVSFAPNHNKDPCVIAAPSSTQTSYAAFWPSQGRLTTASGKSLSSEVLKQAQGVRSAFVLSDSLLLTVGSDASLRLFILPSEEEQHSDISMKWTREEALAQVSQVVSTVLPHNPQSSKAEPTYRFLAQISDLVDTAKSVATASARFWQAITDALVNVARGGEFVLKSVQEASDDERSRFGFLRVFVLLTKKDKLFGMNSETGKVMWSLQLNGEFTDAKLFLKKENGPEPSIVILDSKNGKLWEIASVTGVIKAKSTSISNNLPVLQAFTLNAAHHDHKLVGLNADLIVFSYPPTGIIPDLFIYLLKKDTNEITGYRVESGSIKAMLAWNIVLPMETSIIAYTSTRDVHDAISSNARMLGDGSLLVKYVNPHLIGLATFDAATGLKTYLIDTVVGRIVHRFSHREGTGPVHMVRFENWLVYSFWNTKTKRNELVSATLYDKQPVGKHALNPWSKIPQGLDANFSSFEASELTVLHKTFYIPFEEITALGVTTTLRGIAAKNLLVSLGGTGQILMMDQRFIDPRRTAQPPTEEEKLEGLIQYAPDLPVIPMHVLSYYQGVGEKGANLFHVAPAFLESSCTILACGLDLFKGRASPSGAFDLLAEDFNYALLVLFMVSLVVGVVALRHMERKKSLSHAWL